MSKFQTPEFYALFAEWNQKLKDSGFKDAEDFALPEPALKTWHNFKFKNLTPEELRQAGGYFEFAQNILRNHLFESQTRRYVWWLHTEGKSIRQITHLVSRKKFGRDKIFRFIRSIQETYGLKKR